MKIKTVLVDDDENARKATQLALKHYDFIEIIAEASTQSELFLLLKEQSIDLIFLDIEMQGESGFEIAKYLQDHYPKILFVFLTGHTSYAIDGYDFNPVNFLTKPIHALRLDKTLEEVKKRMVRLIQQEKQQNIQNSKLILRFENAYEIIDISQVLFVERRGRKNFLAMQGGTEKSVYKYSIRELADLLEVYGFFSCHQSYIVPLNRIEAIREDGHQLYYIQLSGSAKKIPLSRKRYEECRKILQQSGMRMI